MPIPSMKEQFVPDQHAVRQLHPGSSGSEQSPGHRFTGGAWLGDLGSCDIQPVSPGKFNLLASYGGSGPGGLVAGVSCLSLCHTMTPQWQTDPLKLTEVDNRWVWLGQLDMKGFFALIIEAVRQVARPAVIKIILQTQFL